MKYTLTIIFFVLTGFYTYNLDLDTSSKILVTIASIAGAYMAMNIGANDNANSVGPAVGSKTITMKQALLISAIGNFLGAIIAGGEVVNTIKDGIIDVNMLGGNTLMFVYIMLSALISAALWLNLATYFKAPVSTTHSIVGGVMGAGVAALGINAVSWPTMSKIVASWIISPLLGGIIAAIFLYLIKFTILFKQDKVHAAKNKVPYFVAIMAWSFTTYIILKGLKEIIHIDFIIASLIGILVSIITFFLVKNNLKVKKGIINERDSINKLFTIPLVFAVALLTFAHGANDVANAIGPLAGIYDSLSNGAISSKASIPFWILFLGGFGISMGLYLFGHRIIETVGGEITEIDQIRAYCITLSAALTVIIASQLGLPVSSTHVAIGGVFGVGFLREYLDRKMHSKKEIYVRRDHIYKIVSAWLITVPIVAFLSGILFLLMSYLHI